VVGNLQPGKHASKAEPKRSIHVQVESWIGGERSGRTGPPSVCLGLSWLHFSFYGQVAQSLYSRAHKHHSRSSSFFPASMQVPAPPCSSSLLHAAVVVSSAAAAHGSRNASEPQPCCVVQCHTRTAFQSASSLGASLVVRAGASLSRAPTAPTLGAPSAMRAQVLLPQPAEQQRPARLLPCRGHSVPQRPCRP